MNSFDQVIEKARRIGPKKLALAGQPKEELAKAVEKARWIGLAEPLIFDDAPSAALATRNGQADVLMKGSVDTKAFMQAVLDGEHGLRGENLVTHVAVIEILGRLILITDAGIILNPTLDEKSRIITNAIPVANSLGIDNPKVAVLAAVEKINPKMPETLDADALSKMNIPGCVVQGPLAVDNAICSDAARTKGITGPVVGHADILLVPSVLVGNIFAKGMMYLADCRFGGIVTGTIKPVTFLSRADIAETMLNTIALGVLASGD